MHTKYRMERDHKCTYKLGIKVWLHVNNYTHGNSVKLWGYIWKI